MSGGIDGTDVVASRVARPQSRGTAAISSSQPDNFGRTMPLGRLLRNRNQAITTEAAQPSSSQIVGTRIEEQIFTSKGEDEEGDESPAFWKSIFVPLAVLLQSSSFHPLILFQIDTACWFLDLRVLGEVRVVSPNDEAPQDMCDVVLKASEDVMLQVMTGEASIITAWYHGKMAVVGDWVAVSAIQRAIAANSPAKLQHLHRSLLAAAPTDQSEVAKKLGGFTRQRGAREDSSFVHKFQGKFDATAHDMHGLPMQPALLGISRSSSTPEILDMPTTMEDVLRAGKGLPLKRQSAVLQSLRQRSASPVPAIHSAVQAERVDVDPMRVEELTREYRRWNETADARRQKKQAAMHQVSKECEALRQLLNDRERQLHKLHMTHTEGSNTIPDEAAVVEVPAATKALPPPIPEKSHAAHAEPTAYYGAQRAHHGDDAALMSSDLDAQLLRHKCDLLKAKLKSKTLEVRALYKTVKESRKASHPPFDDDTMPHHRHHRSDPRHHRTQPDLPPFLKMMDRDLPLDQLHIVLCVLLFYMLGRMLHYWLMR